MYLLLFFILIQSGQAPAMNKDEAMLPVLREVEARFGGLDSGESRAALHAPEAVGSGRHRVGRESAQSHIVFGAPGVAHSDPRRHALVLLAQALGGGMSSRLFQRIREELGLAYAVFSFQAFYRAAGMGGVYLGTRPETEAQAVEAVREELTRLASESLPPEELTLVREQVKGQLTLAMESLGSRMHRLAGFALHGEPVVMLDELLARYDRVSPETLAEAARQFLDPEVHLVLSLGPEGA